MGKKTLLAAAQRKITLGSDSVNRRLLVSNGEKSTQEAPSHLSLTSTGVEMDGKSLNDDIHMKKFAK